MIGNEPAFSVVEHRVDSVGEQRMETIASGMTVRQYFVAQAMMAFITGSIGRHDVILTSKGSGKIISILAVDFADTCLAREAETRETKP
jgi:hypothetical protein